MTQSEHPLRSVPAKPTAPGAAEFQTGTPTTAVARFQQGVISRIRNYFLTGLILVGPLYITISLTWWFIKWVDEVVRPFMPIALRPESYLPFDVPGTGIGPGPVRSIAPNGAVTGFYLDANTVAHGFVREGAGL